MNFLSKHRIFQWFTKRHFNFNFYCNGCLWILGQKLGPTSGSDLFWDDSKWFGAKSQLLPDNLTGVRESQPIKDGRGVEPVVEPVCAETSRFHNKPLAGFSTWSQLLLNLIEPHLCLKFWIYREISILSHLSHAGLVSQLSWNDTFRSSYTHRCRSNFSSIFSFRFFSNLLFFFSCPNSLWPSYLQPVSVSGASHEIVRKPGVRWSFPLVRYSSL